jgi:excisionase family DNA binding protein
MKPEVPLSARSISTLGRKVHRCRAFRSISSVARMHRNRVRIDSEAFMTVGGYVKPTQPQIRHTDLRQTLTETTIYPIEETLVESVQAHGIHTRCIIDLQASAEDFETPLSAQEAASLLSIHVNTLRLWAREGKIPHYRIGRRIAFRASDLNQWLVASCYAGDAVLTAPTERKAA